MRRLFLLLFPCLAHALNINLITYSNGVGIDQDLAIMGEELTKLGHHVEFIYFRDFAPKPKADINVFIERVEEFFFPYAHKNYLMPNPEWFKRGDLIPKFDMILCKTEEALRLFQIYNPRSVYLGFTSRDCYIAEVKKDYRSIIHLVGHSEQKGTDTLYDLWQKNLKLPPLHLLIHRKPAYEEVANIEQVTDYLPLSVLRERQNRCGLHLCPSETEGFGHYLMEALSSGAVVITTDAPPMNEFVSDPRCLVKVRRTQRQDLATNYYFDQSHMNTTLENLIALSDEELEKIGRQNRQRYLKQDHYFKRRLFEIFGEAK